MANIEEPQENYLTGWIKLYRSIENKGWYRDSEYVHLWVHLLLKASHKGKEFMFNNEIVKLKPGQLITGRKALSVETSISESKIERILNLFENERQIEQQTNSRNRVITIVSWDAYQKSEQQMDSKRTASEQPVDTNKNDNNENNDKKILRKRSKEFKAPTLEQVEAYFAEKGYTNAKKAFDYYETGNWKDSNGNQVKNWKQKMQGVWFKEENKLPPKPIIKVRPQSTFNTYPDYLEYCRKNNIEPEPDEMP